jgi:hypothetical protein
MLSNVANGSNLVSSLRRPANCNLLAAELLIHPQLVLRPKSFLHPMVAQAKWHLNKTPPQAD